MVCMCLLDGTKMVAGIERSAGVCGLTGLVPPRCFNNLFSVAICSGKVASCLLRTAWILFQELVGCLMNCLTQLS